MGTKELIELRGMKEKLVKEIIHLRDRLKNQEENGRQESINFNK